MTEDLNNKVAIITGGAQGLGAAIAQTFAKAGAGVVVADVCESAGEAIANQIGTAAVFQHHDVTSEDSWLTLIERVETRFGRVDVLVNNAGIIKAAPLLEMSVQDFDRLLAVNLRGVFLGIKTVAPVMIREGRGVIINIGSTEALRASNSMGGYASSKWGVRALTKTAALELGHRGIRVNAIHPGQIDTPMGNPDGNTDEELRSCFIRQPIQRMCRPNEVARICAFLAADASSYICGADISVDGGATAGDYMDFLPGAPASLSQ